MDSNIPMYLVGPEGARKIDARRLLERLVSDRARLVTDAEVFQEILHRYLAIRRREAIQPAFDALLGVVDEVFPIDQEDVLRAKDLAGTHQRLSARDALHAAVMQRRGVTRILSFDVGFGEVAGIERLSSV